MDASKPDENLLPEDLLAEIEAAATAERRPAGELLREAIQQYLQGKRSASGTIDAAKPSPRMTPLEAATRMLQSREMHPLPEGTSIRDLMTFGRA